MIDYCINICNPKLTQKKLKESFNYSDDILYWAVCARLAAEQCLDWERCDSNSPAYQYVQNNIILPILRLRGSI